VKYLFCFLICNVAHASPGESNRAIAAALNACYKQTGTEEYVNTLAMDLDRQYVPELINDNGVVVLLLLQVTTKHELSWKWSF